MNDLKPLLNDENFINCIPEPVDAERITKDGFIPRRIAAVRLASELIGMALSGHLPRPQLSWYIRVIKKLRKAVDRLLGRDSSDWREYLYRVSDFMEKHRREEAERRSKLTPEEREREDIIREEQGLLNEEERNDWRNSGFSDTPREERTAAQSAAFASFGLKEKTSDSLEHTR